MSLQGTTQLSLLPYIRQKRDALIEILSQNLQRATRKSNHISMLQNSKLPVTRRLRHYLIRICSHISTKARSQKAHYHCHSCGYCPTSSIKTGTSIGTRHA